MRKMLLFALIALVCLSLSACGGKRYHVDYGGGKFAFPGAKDSYTAGSTVKLRFDCIATDTDYTFYVDGNPVNPAYEDNCFVITFTMPEHDVTVSWDEVNSMTWQYMAPSRCLVLRYDENAPEYTPVEGAVNLYTERLGEDGPLCLRLTLINLTEETFCPNSSFTLEKQTDDCFSALEPLREPLCDEIPAELLPGETGRVVCNLSCYGEYDSFKAGIYRLTIADAIVEFEIDEEWTE